MKSRVINKKLYWLLQLTWGLPMNIVALIVIPFVLLFRKHVIHHNGYSVIIEFGGNWGGLELGAFALCGGYTTTCESVSYFDHVREHEFGHTLQNIIWGPLYPFVIGIPSACRYWYSRIPSLHKNKLPLGWYDSIWFEGQATRWGRYYHEQLKEKF